MKLEAKWLINALFNAVRNIVGQRDIVLFDDTEQF